MSGTLAISAVDLFCGAGGLTKGLEKSGIDVLLGIDSDPYCEYPYTKNNNANFLLSSVENVSGEDLLQIYQTKPNSIKLLAGCAPCQTFSPYNQKATSKDDRWWLLSHFSRLICEIKPDIVTMENVPLLKNKDVYFEFVKTLKNEGYEVNSQVVNCSEFNLPQNRKRLVLLASKFGEIKLIKPQNKREKKTVKDAIGDLPKLKAGDVFIPDPLHQTSSLSEINFQRIKSSVPGGSWLDWEPELIADCHKKTSGKTFSNVYGRMKWDEPAPTITTQFYIFGTGRFGHPEQDRALSLREGAILQGFPNYYKFFHKKSPISKKIAGRLIGNAVPVKLAEFIGKSIIKHIEEIHE